MKEFIDILLEKRPLAEYGGLIIFSIIGFVISVLIELLRTRKKIKAKGGFSIKVWLLDNWVRSSLSIILILVGVLYIPEIGKLIGFDLEVNNKGALVAGFMTDKIIEALITIKPKQIIDKLISKRS